MLPLRLVSALSVGLYGMFLAIIIPPARKNRVVAALVGLGFLTSFGLGRLAAALSLGCYMAELTEAVCPEDVPAPELLRHLLNGLYALSTLHKPPALVKPAFELRLLCLAGYEPLAEACALCGREDPAEPVLDAAQGVLRCRDCGGGGGRPLCRDSLAALRHIICGDPKRLYSFRLGEEPLRRLTAAAEAFLYAQLERGLSTLDFYKSIL